MFWSIFGIMWWFYFFFSLMAHNVEYLFMYMFVNCISFLGKRLFTFAFYKTLFVLVLLNFESFLWYWYNTFIRHIIYKQIAWLHDLSLHFLSIIFQNPFFNYNEGTSILFLIKHLVLYLSNLYLTLLLTFIYMGMPVLIVAWELFS